MDYWYHFAIMFEALFILTAIDAGTRVGRFLVGEFLGRVYPPFARPDWMPGSLISTGVIVVGWGVFHLDGEHQHHLADVRHRQSAAGVVALAVGTTVLINVGRARYAWVTLVPMRFWRPPRSPPAFSA